MDAPVFGGKVTASNDPPGKTTPPRLSKGEAFMRIHHSSSLLGLLTLVTCTAAGQSGGTITRDGVGVVRLCQPLSVVGERFPSAWDTLVTSEEVEWPVKVVRVASGHILFEASWRDTAHVWRISTNDPRYRTERGYRVGVTLGYLLDKGEKLTFKYEEGFIVVTLGSEQVSFLPDDSTARAFLGRSSRAMDSLEALPRTARIQKFIVIGHCDR